MNTRTRKHRARNGSRRNRKPKNRLLQVTGLVLITGAVGATAVQLLTESSPVDRTSVTRPLSAGSSVEATLPLETLKPALERKSPEPLRSTMAIAKPSAQAVPTPNAAPRSTSALAQARERSALAHAAAIETRETRRQLVDRMRSSSDADTRLGTAREILAAHGTSDANDALLDMSLQVLAELNPSAVPATLQDLLRNCTEDSQVDLGVSLALSSIARDDTVLSSEELVSCYENGSRKVRLAAAKALSQRGDDLLSRRLQDQCADELRAADGDVRAKAVRDLAAQHSPALPELVGPLLADAERSVRLQSVRALERSEDPAVINRMRALVNDPALDVRRAAQRAVQRMDQRTANSR